MTSSSSSRAEPSRRAGHGTGAARPEEARRREIRFADAPLRVAIEFYGADPRADIDNLVKHVLDGLQKGGAFDDDRQVVRLAAERHEGPARTVVRIETLA